MYSAALTPTICLTAEQDRIQNKGEEECLLKQTFRFE